MIPTLALTNLWRNRVRTALTAAGVIVVVAAYLSVSYYFSFIASQVPVKPASLPADVVVSLRLRDPDVPAYLSGFREIERYEPLALARLNTSLGAVECFGIVPSSVFLPFGEFTAGRSPLTAGEIAIPANLARVEEVEVGGTIELSSFLYGAILKREFLVVGVFTPKDARYDAPVLLGEEVRAIGRAMTRYLLRLKPGTNIERFAANLEGDSIRVNSVETERRVANAEAAEAWKSTWGAAQSSARMLVTVVLIIAGLGVLNTMMVSVLQRQREFGIMKACGMVEGQVLQLFAHEGLIIAALGYGLGVGVYFAGLCVLRAMGLLEIVTATSAALVIAWLQALAVCIIPSLIPALDVASRSANELLMTR